MLVIPALKRLELGDNKFRASLDYETVTNSQKQTTTTTTKQERRLVSEELNTSSLSYLYYCVISYNRNNRNKQPSLG